MEDEEAAVIRPLSELLSAKKDGAAEPPPAPEPEEASVASEPAATEQADPPPPADVEPKSVPMQAYHAEKTKRQELEARLKELEAKIAPQQQQQPSAPDIFDPEFASNLRNEMQGQLETQAWLTRIAINRIEMRGQHPDFDEMEQAYVAAEKEGLVPPVPRGHQSPAEFVYNAAKRLSIANAVGGDLGKYESGLREKIKAELEAEAAKKAEAKRAAILPTSAGERSATPDKGAEGWSPKGLDELLKPKKRA